MTDVVVAAPPALYAVRGEIPSEGISDREIISMQQAEIRVLQEEVRKLRVTANTIAGAAGSMAEMLRTPDSDYVRIPADIVRRMRGVKVSMGTEDDGSMFFRWVERGPELQWEGRSDD